MNYYEMVKKTPPDQILWIDEKNTYYYGDILKQAEDLAAGLNTDEKEVIGIYSNSPLFQLTAFLACGKREKIPVILHPGLTETELENIMKVNRIRFLLSENGLRKKCESKPEIKSKWCVAVLTSGSNGTPKLLYRTYQSWAGFFETQNSVFQIDSDTRLFFQGSLSFTGNLNTVLSVLYESASVVTYGGYHPRKWLSLIRQHSVNSIYLVPVKLRSLCLESGEPIGNIRSVFTGSQHLRENWMNMIMEIFKNAEKIMYYGAGELSASSSNSFTPSSKLSAKSSISERLHEVRCPCRHFV